MLAFVLSLIPFVYALFSTTVFNLWLTGWAVEFRSEMPPLLVALFPHALDRDAASVSKVTDLPAVLLRDFALVALFAVQHSVMARPAFKRMIVRLGFPVHLERSLYVLASCVVVHLIPVYALSFGPELYSTSGLLRTVIQSLRLFGLLFQLVAMLSFDFFDLLGVKQAWNPEAYKNTLNKKMVRQRAERQGGAIGCSLLALLITHLWSRVLLVCFQSLNTNGLFGYMRHPIMTGFLVILWAAPDMTLGRLYLSALLTGYIMLAVFAFEEPDLRCAFANYSQYSKVVPPFFPHSIHAATLQEIDAAADTKRN